MSLTLSPTDFAHGWSRLVGWVDQQRLLPATPVRSTGTVETVEAHVASLDFDTSASVDDVLAWVRTGIEYRIRTNAPGYLGRFVPAPADVAVLGHALVGAANPQLAAWDYCPFGVALERRLTEAFAGRMGLPAGSTGTFTSGASEANLTGVLLGLNQVLPDFRTQGLRGAPGHPRVYCARGTHDSVRKAVRMLGLGERGLMVVPCDVDSGIRLDALRRLVDADVVAGHLPAVLVGNAGTTGWGGCDDLAALRGLADQYGLWLHVDAAWGGAWMLHSGYQDRFPGVRHADSVALDCHKLLSMPLGTGMLLTPRREGLSAVFGTAADYMPSGVVGEPFQTSPQWSRPFRGLPLAMTLGVSGWQGYEALVDRVEELSKYLAAELRRDGWHLRSGPRLGIVCFVDSGGSLDEHQLEAFARAVLDQGSWVSLVRLPDGTLALRLCITNHRTTRHDVSAVVRVLGSTRAHLGRSRATPVSHPTQEAP